MTHYENELFNSDSYCYNTFEHIFSLKLGPALANEKIIKVPTESLYWCQYLTPEIKRQQIIAKYYLAEFGRSKLVMYH